MAACNRHTRHWRCLEHSHSRDQCSLVVVVVGRLTDSSSHQVVAERVLLRLPRGVPVRVLLRLPRGVPVPTAPRGSPPTSPGASLLLPAALDFARSRDAPIRHPPCSSPPRLPRMAAAASRLPRMAAALPRLPRVAVAVPLHRLESLGCNQRRGAQYLD